MKTQLIAIAGSLALLLLVIDLVRRRRLKEEYSFLWVMTALGLLVLATWLDLLRWVTTAIGGVAPSSTIFFFGLLFVFLMLLHFSVRVSAMERRLTTLVQEIGIRGVGGAEPKPVAAPAPEPRVAVVIPCFNDGAFAIEAVGSISEHERIEVVVVDDGSTDPETLEALEELERFSVGLIRQDNQGLGAARMAGVAATSAPFVFPLDADDRLEPGALGALADALERAPRAAFAWGDYLLFGDGTGRYRAPREWLPWTLTFVNPYPVSSLIRRSALERTGGWQMRAYEDWDLWLRFAGLGLEGVGVQRIVYQRRLHDEARLLTGARGRHQELYAELRKRNEKLFARRDELLAREAPSPWKRLAYPVLFGARTVVPYSVEAFLQRMMMRLGSGLPG